MLALPRSGPSSGHGIRSDAGVSRKVFERILRMELLEVFCKADVSLEGELVTCISTDS